ncbi:MAG: hypothetical protein LBE20_04855 [Deltaproteobacteria bacterium]|jgi:hypothetical protein|nr:hypothetical protein [Deltaproteobacteria bacterium]
MRIEQKLTQTQGMTSADLPKNSKVEGVTFKTVLSSVVDNNQNLKNHFSQMLSNYVQTWNNSETGLKSRLTNIAPESKKIIELQIAVNRFNLQTLLVTQCAEACSGTVKRVQQLGSN